MKGTRRTAWRQIPNARSMGIHHVAVAQYRRVRPATKGRIELGSAEPSAALRSAVPAIVEMATAPMQIRRDLIYSAEVLAGMVSRSPPAYLSAPPAAATGVGIRRRPRGGASEERSPLVARGGLAAYG